MKQAIREYGCMLFGHEDGPDWYCVHCGTRNPWAPLTEIEKLVQRYAAALWQFSKSMASVQEAVAAAARRAIDGIELALATLEKRA